MHSHPLGYPLPMREGIEGRGISPIDMTNTYDINYEFRLRKVRSSFSNFKETEAELLIMAYGNRLGFIKKFFQNR